MVEELSIDEQRDRQSLSGVLKAVEREGAITPESLLTLTNIMRKDERDYHIEIVVHTKTGVTALVKTIDTEKLALETIENYRKLKA